MVLTDILIHTPFLNVNLLGWFAYRMPIIAVSPGCKRDQE